MRSFLKPNDGLRCILGDALTSVVERTEVILRGRIALLGGLAIPLCSLNITFGTPWPLIYNTPRLFCAVASP